MPDRNLPAGRQAFGHDRENRKSRWETGGFIVCDRLLYMLIFYQGFGF